MSYFYQINISNPLFNQDYHEINRNIKLSQLIYKNILDKQIQEKKEREKFYLSNEQILQKRRGKSQPQYSINNNIFFQSKEGKNFSNINQEGNYNFNFEENISPIYNRPSFIRRNRNEKIQNFMNYR